MFRNRPHLTALLAVALITTGVALGMTATALSGGTIVALALIFAGGWLLTYLIPPAAVEHTTVSIDDAVALADRAHAARLARERAAAAALVAYAQGAPADEAMRAFRTAS